MPAGEGREKGVVLATGERESRLGTECRGLERDGDPRRRREATGIERQPVRDIQHRSRPGRRRRDSRGDRRGRTQLRTEESALARRHQAVVDRDRDTGTIAEPIEQERETRGGLARAAREGDDLSGARAAPQDGACGGHRTQRRHRDRQGVGHRQVAALDGASGCELIAGGPQARGQVLHEAQARVVGHRERDEESERTRTHRGDVREVDRGGLPSEIEPARPGQAEVGPVHERVGRRDDRGPRIGEHRGVIARTDEGSRRPQVREEPREHLGLTEGADGPVAVAHPSTLAPARGRPDDAG